MSRHAMHEANRRGWDAISAQWQAGIDAKVDWRQIPVNPGLVLDNVELDYLGDVSGRSACVLAAGTTWWSSLWPPPVLGSPPWISRRLNWISPP